VASLSLLAFVVLTVIVNHPTQSQAAAPYQPSVKLKCSEPVCGSNQTTNEWSGIYRVAKDHLPANTRVVVQVTLPNSQLYPYSKYENAGKLYGVKGSLLRTNGSGLLTQFEWSAYNGVGKQVDEPGVYKVRFYLKVHGKVVLAHARMVMVRLPIEEEHVS
jgi:hypothetical protein